MKAHNIDEFIDKISSNNHLSYLIRATEKQLYLEDEEVVKLKLEKLDEKRQQGLSKEKYQIALNEIRCYEQNHMFNKIVLVQSIDRNVHGFTTLFDKGAHIRYSADVEHIVRHIIIAHEIGHLLLHTTRDNDGIRHFSQIEDDALEIEATEFAKKILLKRAEYFVQSNFKEEDILYEEYELEEIITRIQIKRAPKRIPDFS